MAQFEWTIPKTPLFNTAKAKTLIRDKTRKTLNIMLTTVQTNVKFGAPVGDTTELKNKIFTEVFGLIGRVFSGAFYGIIIEKGRKAAPVAKSADRGLLNWIRRSTKGQAYFSGLKSRFPNVTLKGALFLLKRSMARKKRKPNPFFERGVKRSRNRLNREKSILLETFRRLLV